MNIADVRVHTVHTRPLGLLSICQITNRLPRLITFFFFEIILLASRDANFFLNILAEFDDYVLKLPHGESIRTRRAERRKAARKHNNSVYVEDEVVPRILLLYIKHACGRNISGIIV